MLRIDCFRPVEIAGSVVVAGYELKSLDQLRRSFLTAQLKRNPLDRVRTSIPMGRAATISLVITIIAACESAGHRGRVASLRTEVDSSGDIIRVRNYGQAPLWRLEQVLSLGSEGALERPAPDEFGRITSVTLGPRNRLYVADTYYDEIRVFNLTGEFLFSFGRDGQGPGEFKELYSLAWVGDTLLALDFGNARIGEFDRDGSWLGQRWHPGGISGSPSTLRLYRVTNDEAYAWSLEPVEGELKRSFRRHTPGGAEGQLWQVSGESRPSDMIICTWPDGGFTGFDVPFTPRLLQHPAQGMSLAAAWTNRYKIVLLNSDLDTVRVVEREAAPIAVSDAEWESELAGYRSFREKYPETSCNPRSVAKPEWKPPIVDLYLDWTGRMWVETVTQTGTVWEIFDPEGRLVGQIPSVPRSEEVAPYIGVDYLAVVATDSLDVESVQVYKFTRTES